MDNRTIEEIRENETKLIKEIKRLEEAEKEYDRTFGIRHNRKLIKKFDDEYDEADKKNNPERDYAYAMPDAEEVYKRYYELKEKLEASEKARKEAIELIYKTDIFTWDHIMFNKLSKTLNIDKGE